MPVRVEPKVSTSYHRGMIDNGLLSRLESFIMADLSSQLPVPADDIHGTIMPCYDEERYCGPNSAVKDIYRLELCFQAGSEILGTFKDEISYNTASQTFAPRRRHRRLLVATQARKEVRRALGEAVDTLCQRISKEHLVGAACPKCSTALNIIDSPALFDVTCPQGCFTYEFHRDPGSGEFQHGHVFFGQTE
jgi:hypothetical protein